MKRIIGLLMVVGMMVGVGCSGDKPTGPRLELKTEEAADQVTQFRMYIESFETEAGYDKLHISVDGDSIQSLEGNINSGWTDWYDIKGETEKLTFVFISDSSERYEGFDISRISFRDSDLGEETTVEVEIRRARRGTRSWCPSAS